MSQTKRLTWNEYFLQIAEVVAQRATCPRAKCGCVLVDPKSNFILSTGYNGAPPGEPHCIEDGCIMVDNHCQRAIHAEINAIAHAARHGIPIAGAEAYIFGERADGNIKDVCRECQKVLNATNIHVNSIRSSKVNGHTAFKPKENPHDKEV